MGDAPQDDVLYNVVIGETVTGGSDDHYHVLQYGFKPASIDRTQEGVLKKTENGAIEVEFANTNSKGPDNKVYFKGQYAPCKEYECILIFDSSSSTFRLERLMGQGKGLKVVRKDQTKYTGKLEVPPDIAEPPEVPRQRASTRPKPEPIVSSHSLNGVTATTGGSPPDGDDGATPATKRARTTKKTSTTTKRPRKTAAKGAKEKPEAASSEEPDDLLALVESIESSVPSDTTSQGEEEDFLAAAFESDTPSETPAVSTPFPSSTSIKPPPPLPSSTHQPHQFPPIQPPNTALGLPSRNGQLGYSNGGAAASANGALPNGAAPKAKADGDSSSGSESESASESESESESASESSSESESENE